MKQLMLGNAAVARGLYEAGCCVISSYPGTPSTEITEEAAKFDDIYCEWAPNEKVAMEVAFGASLIRNLLGLGTIMAFPGSMCGALLCGLVFLKTRNLPATLVGEVFGTGIIGGLAASPVAILFTGADAATVAFYAYIVPFLISTVAGAILAGILVAALGRTGALSSMRTALER